MTRSKTIVGISILILIAVLLGNCSEAPEKISAETHYDTAIVSGADGNFVKAKVLLEQALEVDPLYTPASSSLEILEGILDKSIEEDAARHLFTAIKLGNDYKPEEKIAALNKALDIHPDLALAYNERGTAYYHLGNFKKAVADREQAIYLKPFYAEPYYNKAVACEELGRYEDAYQAYQDYIRYAPVEHRKHVDYARLRMDELRKMMANKPKII